MTGLAAAEEVYEVIYGLIRAAKPEVCIETGTAEGSGSACIARALDANGKGHVWTVDNQAREIIPHERITQAEGDSLAFVHGFDRHIDFAFVDCSMTTRRSEIVKLLLDRAAGLVVLDDVVPFGVGLPPGIILPTLSGLGIWQGSAERPALEPADWNRMAA